MAQGFYGGYLGNAGAFADPMIMDYRPERDGYPELIPLPASAEPEGVGQTLAGSPGYFLPETEIQKRMQDRYYQTPAGQDLRERINKVREKIQQGQFFPSASVGGEGGLIAQAYPGGQAVGNAAALGSMMEMGPRFGPRPFNVDINAVDDRLESIGGSANIELDANQRLRFGGNFNPAAIDEMGMATPQGYQVYGAYETPGFGVNLNYRNTGRRGMQGPGMMGGFPGEINAGFKGRF